MSAKRTEMHLPALLAVTAGCLALMMLMGIAVRIRIRGSALGTLPALVLLGMKA